MILLIDTSGSELHLGLGDLKNNLLSSKSASAKAGERGIHDAKLALEVEAILKETGTPTKAITKVGIVIGPGSFTGLRIGVAFAKGFASVWGAEIIPIIAHELLSDPVQPAETPLLIVAYQPHLAYLSPNGHPNDVRLTKLDEIGGREYIDGMSLSVGEKMRRMLNLALFAASGDIASLEPLYLTEFLPTNSSTNRKSEPKPAKKV